MGLEAEVQKMNKMLASRKTAQPAPAFAFLDKTPTDLMVFSLAGASNAKVANKIRNYLRRWRPLRLALPTASLELEALGMPRGAKFDKVMEAFFQAQLLGKGRTPGGSNQAPAQAGRHQGTAEGQGREEEACGQQQGEKETLRDARRPAIPAEKSAAAPRRSLPDKAVAADSAKLAAKREKSQTTGTPVAPGRRRESQKSAAADSRLLR